MTHSTENRIDTEALLARMPLFSDLSHERIVALAEHSRGKRLPKGEMLFQKGDHARGFYVVVYGQVKLAFPASNGNEKVVDIVGGQQSFGEAVMLAQHTYPVFAQALADSLLVFVPREAVFTLLENEPAFARRMLIGLAMHNHSLVHDIESYTQRSSAQRVVGYLLQNCPHDDVDTSAAIALPTSKQVTASRLNLTPETLSRIFHDLTEAGLIEMKGKRILIHSVRRLRDSISGNPAETQSASRPNVHPHASKHPHRSLALKPADVHCAATHGSLNELAKEHRVTASSW